MRSLGGARCAMKNFTLGPSKDLLGHLKIFKIGYFSREFAGTIICLDKSNQHQKLVNMIPDVYKIDCFIFQHRFITRSNSLGVTLILGVLGVICHYLRPLDKTILKKKKTIF